MVSVELAMFCVALFRQQTRLGWFWTIENPATSRLFEFRPVLELSGLPNVIWFKWDMCRYNQPSRKSTGMLTNLTNLKVSARNCLRNHQHIQLRGTEHYMDETGSLKTRNKTSAAGEYPWSLCHEWSRAVQQTAPTSARAPDTTGFAQSFRERLKEVAGFKIRCTNKSEPRTTLTSNRHKILSKGHRLTVNPSSLDNTPPRRRRGSSNNEHDTAKMKRRKCSTDFVKFVRPEDCLRMLAVKKPILERYIIQTNLFRTWAKAHRKSISDHKRLDSAMAQSISIGVV